MTQLGRRGPARTLGRIAHWTRGFRGRRLAGGGAAAVIVAAALAAEPVSGQLVGLAVPWWSYPTIAVAAVLVGVVAGSFIQPRRGAEPTVCEVGPIVFGAAAAYFSAVPRTAGSQAAAFLDSLGAVGAGIAQPVFAGIAVLLLAGAVADRAKRERYGEAETDTDTADGEVCVTCAPLFPARRAAPVLDEATEVPVGRG